jgi:glycosyltransferase involved in cell wall biosynthesis
VSEIIEHGVTGFIVDGENHALADALRVGELSRHRCRAVFEQRFSAERMASDYVKVYEQLAQARHRPIAGVLTVA